MADIYALFKELDSHIKDQDYKNALKTADKILAVDTHDQDAILCKGQCLIQLGEYEEALKVLEKDHVFERSYCLYNLKKYNESLQLLNGVENPKPNRVLELTAQVYYRMENYEASTKVYQELLYKNKVESPELKANLVGAYTQSTSIKDDTIITTNSEPTSYEFAYNAACYYISVGNFDRAQTLLKNALSVGERQLKEDGLNEKEIQNELAAVQAQFAFLVQQKDGPQATQLYHDLLNLKPTDLSVVAVVNNNLIALNKNHDLFDSLKKIKNLSSDEINAKLTPAQRKMIGFNHCLILAHANKLDQCQALVKSFQEEYPKSAEEFALIAIAATSKKKKIDETLEKLEKLQAENPASVPVLLSRAQILLDLGRSEAACAALETLPSEVLFSAAVVSTLSALYASLQRSELADDIIARYSEKLNFSAKNSPLDAEVLAKILPKIGAFKLKQKSFSEAAAIYKKIFEIQNNNESLAAYIFALSYLDPLAAEKLAGKLSIQGIPEVNAEALENLQAPKLKASIISEDSAKSAPVEDKKKEKKKIKRRKKKKIRLPKNYDPNAAPDTERWLPKKERSSFRRKGKKAEKDKIKGTTQGSASMAPIALPKTGPQPATPKNISPKNAPKNTPKGAPRRGKR